jgi:hypothetical protein
LNPPIHPCAWISCPAKPAGPQNPHGHDRLREARRRDKIFFALRLCFFAPFR